MAVPPFTITDRSTGKVVHSLAFSATGLGASSETRELTVTNNTGKALDLVRVAAKLINGQLTGGEDVQGQEAIDEQWVEARVPPNPFESIGGPYGDSDPATNYLDVGAVGIGASFDLDVRYTLPASVDTEEVFYARLAIVAREL